MTQAVKSTSPTTVAWTIEYGYCPTCSGALRSRKKMDGNGAVVSWLRYEYEGLNLLRIDERWDRNGDGLDENDPWRPVNVFVHGPGVIGNVFRASWYRYTWDNSDTPCEFPAFDAQGNRVDVVTNGGSSFASMRANPE